MKKQRVLCGYTFRHPKGHLDYRVVWSVETAQSNAAFASDRPYSHIRLPDDWNQAYKQGFRVVPAELLSGVSKRSWKKPAGGS